MKHVLSILLITALLFSFTACGEPYVDTPDTPEVQDTVNTTPEPEGTLLEQVLPEDVALMVSDIGEKSVYECNPMIGGLSSWRRFTQGEAAEGRKCMILYNTNPADKSNAEVILYDRDHYRVLHSQSVFDDTTMYKHCYYVFDTDAENPAEVYMLLSNEEHLQYEDIKDLDNGHHDSGIWVRRLSAKIGDYYWSDGTDNLTREEAACQGAVDALKAMTEAKNETLMQEGTLKAFRWEALEVDPAETANYIASYSGFNEHSGHGIPTDSYLNDFLAVKAEFYVEYHENYMASSGHGSTHIYMMRDENEEWKVKDFSMPVMGHE